MRPRPMRQVRRSAGDFRAIGSCPCSDIAMPSIIESAKHPRPQPFGKGEADKTKLCGHPFVITRAPVANAAVAVTFRMVPNARKLAERQHQNVDNQAEDLRGQLRPGEIKLGRALVLQPFRAIETIS